jgi:hypothetical protein
MACNRLVAGFNIGGGFLALRCSGSHIAVTGGFLLVLDAALLGFRLLLRCRCLTLGGLL